MKKQFDIKKLVLLNLPYLLMGLFATNFGEAWRLAQGANASEKFLSLFAVLPGALQSFWPSLHPLDLLVGLCCGAGLRLAVYLKCMRPLIPRFISSAVSGSTIRPLPLNGRSRGNLLYPTTMWQLIPPMGPVVPMPTRF